MWDTPFDESMLGLKQGVVIRCPEEHLAWELFEIFEQNGIGENWKREDWNPNWGSYREETAYFVKGKKIIIWPKGTRRATWLQLYELCKMYLLRRYCSRLRGRK